MPRVRELRFERLVPAAPDEVWRWITEPDLMNRWSEAKIAMAPGADTREVTVRSFGLTSRLREEILDRDPPSRFVYRVVRHPTIRDHLGVQELTPEGDATRLVWTVRFRGVVPGLSAVLAAILEPSLGRSLDVLVAAVAAQNLDA